MHQWMHIWSRDTLIMSKELGIRINLPNQRKITCFYLKVIKSSLKRNYIHRALENTETSCILLYEFIKLGSFSSNSIHFCFIKTNYFYYKKSKSI